MGGLYLISMVKDIGVQLVGLSAATAANAVAMIAIFNTVGRIILGTLSDKIGRMKIVSATFIIIGLSVFTLSFIPLNYGIYFACVASVAFCFGGNITIFPAIVGDFFGLKTIVQITGLSTKVSDLVRLQDHSLERYWRISTNFHYNWCFKCYFLHYFNINPSTNCREDKGTKTSTSESGVILKRVLI